MTFAISFADIEAAAGRLRGAAHRTPVVHSRTADARTGARLFFKCENLQRTGAFKFRGAYNALAQFSPEQRRGGVITFSSGNHAQAIALAAQLLGMPALIIMPSDAPANKVAATCVIEITLDTIFTQCQKALVRSKLWDPATQVERSTLPTVGEIMTTITAGEFDGAAYDAAYPERLRRTIY